MNERPLWKEARAEIRCAPGRLLDVARSGVPAELDGLLRTLGFSIVESIHHIFMNGGFTYVAILKESHLALHSWPEHDVALLDIFVCSDPTDEAILHSVSRIGEWLDGAVLSSCIRRR